MQNMIKANKQRAIELVRFANPKSRIRPTVECVMEILSMYLPYGKDKPVITNMSVIEYHKNNIIKSAYFRVETASGRVFKISAYQNLTGRTQQQKEEDKTATFPSGLFNIFHDEIITA